MVCRTVMEKLRLSQQPADGLVGTLRAAVQSAVVVRADSGIAATTVRQCPDGTSNANCVDYFYSPSFDENGIAQGLWGIFRSYDPTAPAQRLAALPNNPIAPSTNVTYATCPANLPASQRRTFNITAVTAQKALANIAPVPGSNPPQGELIFNDRGPRANWIGSLMGIMYVRSEDLDSNGRLKTGVPVEPLILRANAGDCINVNLTNAIAPSSLVLQHNFNWPPPFKTPITQKMSKFVGLHPQLLSYDAASSFGMNVGWNSKGRADQFANFNETVKYQWYAGKIDRGTNGALTYTAGRVRRAQSVPVGSALPASQRSHRSDDHRAAGIDLAVR